MGNSADVLIVGGGVIGLTTAYFLARDGVKVRVLERGEPGKEASWAGAGIIPPGNYDAAKTPYDQLRALSSQMYPALTAELLERTGQDNGYRVCGGLELFHEDAQDVLNRWREERIEYQLLSPTDAHEYEPNLLPHGTIVWLPTMAQVRNPRHVQALLQACRSCGVDVVAEQTVGDFRRDGSRVLAARTLNGTEWPAKQFLLAPGAWGDSLLRLFGAAVGIHPVRGQIVLFQCTKPPFRMVVCDDKNYLVPRDDGRVLAGATEEPEAGFVKQNTIEGVQGLMRFAQGLVPLLETATVEQTWSGLRPGTRDGLPYLGAIPNTSNAFIAGGHYRAGVQLSPGTARVMADLLQGRRPPIDLHLFRMDRPIGPRFTPAFRS